MVGACALAFHGVLRATGDIDVLVRPSVENARRLIRALTRFGAPIAAAGVTETDFGQPGVVNQIGFPPRRIDVLTAISGVESAASEPSVGRSRAGINFVNTAIARILLGDGPGRWAC